MTVVKSRVLRALFLTLGFVFLGLAFVGIFVPVLPTTGPVLAAAYFFSRSSKRFDDWLINNRLFGSIVRDWRAGLGFTVRAKAIAVAAIVLSFAFTTILFIEGFVLRGILWIGAALIALYVVTRPTKQPDATPEPASEGASA